MEAAPVRSLPTKDKIAVLMGAYTHSLGKLHLVNKKGEEDLYLVLKGGEICPIEWVEGKRTCVSFSSLKEVLGKKKCLLSFTGNLPSCKKKIYSHQLGKSASFY